MIISLNQKKKTQKSLDYPHLKMNKKNINYCDSYEYLTICLIEINRTATNSIDYDVSLPYPRNKIKAIRLLHYVPHHVSGYGYIYLHFIEGILTNNRTTRMMGFYDVTQPNALFYKSSAFSKCIPLFVNTTQTGVIQELNTPIVIGLGEDLGQNSTDFRLLLRTSNSLGDVRTNNIGLYTHPRLSGIDLLFEIKFYDKQQIGPQLLNQ